MRPGNSAEMRSFFVRKHILYVFTFISVWTCSLASAYYHLYYPEDRAGDIPLVDKVSVIANISTGLLMGLIRLFEPYFFFLLKKYFKAMFGIIMTEHDYVIYSLIAG
jgi:hypothetical protein